MSSELDPVERPYAAIVGEARALVAAGREVSAEALRLRIRGATRALRERGADAAEAERAEARALAELDRVAAVQRARARLAREVRPPERPSAPAARRRPAIRTRPTVTGNMDVRRAGAGVLAWDRVPAVVEWEVRLSERSDGARDYAVRETTTLPAEATSFELALGEADLRVHLLGRGRGGRLVRRAIVSGLSAASWDDRWQRRASAS